MNAPLSECSATVLWEPNRMKTEKKSKNPKSVSYGKQPEVNVIEN